MSLFNNGLYFSDMIYKAAFGLSSPRMLLLCKVKIGKPDVRTEARLKSLPKLCDSVKLEGRTGPSEKKKFNDTWIPSGSVKTSNKYTGQFDYNEYIIYDEKLAIP